jgi:hypothetical protein
MLYRAWLSTPFRNYALVSVRGARTPACRADTLRKAQHMLLKARGAGWQPAADWQSACRWYREGF